MSEMAKRYQNIILDSDVYNAGLEQFEDNLTDILHIMQRKECLIIIGKLVSNLKRSKPLFLRQLLDLQMQIKFIKKLEKNLIITILLKLILFTD